MSRLHSLANHCLPALLASTVLLIAPRSAHAKSGTAIGVDWDYTNGIDEPAARKGGTGFNVRLGYKLDLKLLQLTPEVGGGYHTFGGDAGVKLEQGFVGARVSFLKVLEPGAYAHIGYGHMPGGYNPSRSAMTVDAGLTLDLTILPLVDIGVHGGYNGMPKSGDDPGSAAFDSYVLGLHGALIF